MVDEIKFETVKLFEVVAMRDSPEESEVIMEFDANEVEFVPPFDTGRVPVIEERVVVAVQVGTPFCKARVKPSVPDDVVDSLWVPLPRRMELA